MLHEIISVGIIGHTYDQVEAVPCAGIVVGIKCVRMIIALLAGAG